MTKKIFKVKLNRLIPQYFSYIVTFSFIGGENQKVTDKLYHIMLYTSP
jgi:hypothetical protein